jgi:hypothetical protein
MANKEVNLGDTSLKIKNFKMKNLNNYATIVMIAARNSGKSWVCRDILKAKADIPCGMVIAPTDKMNGFYNEFVPEAFIHYDFDPSLIQMFLRRQEIMIEKAEEKEKEGKFLDPSSFLLMDDCMAKKKSWINDDAIREIFMNGRHYKMTYLLTMQFSLGIAPELRSNFDYVFLLRAPGLSDQARIFNHYAGGIFPTFDSFKVVFDELTANYGCMVIDNKSRSEEVCDRVFWYRAKDHKRKFKIGSSKFKDFNQRHFDPNWKKKKPQFDITQMMTKKKNKCNFLVTKVR